MRYDAREAVRFLDQMRAKTLILTVGLPYSGKSIWARAVAFHATMEAIPVVNRDAIRIALHGKRYDSKREPEVSDIEETMVRALFLAGHDTIIVDACHTSEPRRDRWRLPDEWDLRFKMFLTDKETCIGRAEAAGDLDMVPVIGRMAAEMEELGPNDVPVMAGL